MSREFVAPSNFQVVVESTGRAHFESAMRIIFDGHPKATNYAIDTANRKMTLYWHDNSKQTKLPYEMGVDQAIDFVWGWLQSVDRGSSPDLDGSTYPNGYIVRHTDSAWEYKMCEIKAVHSEYHK